MTTTTPVAATHETAVTNRPPPSGAVDAALGFCLVTSVDHRVRGLLAAAAREGGWQTRVCSTPKDALRETVLHRVPLALVDVGSVEDRAVYADLLRMVRSSSDGLVVVCDQSANAEGELWARQAGAWVYLSGVDEYSDVGSVCRQARQLFEEKFYPSCVTAKTAAEERGGRRNGYVRTKRA